MAGEKKLKREPFAYISKRDGVSLTYRITVRAAAIVLALVVCGIVTKVLTGDNPISIYQTIVHGAVGITVSTHSFWKNVTFRRIC